MEKEKNTMKMENFGLNVNIYMVKNLNVKNILTEIQNMKEIIYLVDLITDIGMIKMVIFNMK